MSESLTIKSDSLEPLFSAWEEPVKHRVRADGGGAAIRDHRRPTGIMIAQHLRGAVKDWRDSFYPGASDTTRYLLNHWFNRSHQVGGNEFRYYFCQREAVETFIYLKEVRKLECLSQVIAEFGGAHAETAALGITEDEDAWSRYAFKMATGAGKTKVMSLCIVWSYFHALRETDSPMARHFVVIAPNLTVFERLKEDFKPEDGGMDVFDKDPLIPVEWRDDWNLTTVLQDEAGGAHTGGVLYLTNIHRLFERKKVRKTSGEAFEWMGPAVAKASALDTAEALRERITGHERVMVLNDEAHHVWDPDSAWNEAISWLHETLRKRGGALVSQLDFSATPKDNRANFFKHIVCDTPLGEAVDAGIVKTPIIGRAGKLVEQATDDAAYKYEAHLKLGYQRWLKSREEWLPSGKKPLLFVMCNDTKEADEITRRLQGDAVFKELNGRTINLHTNLKGKINKKTGGFDPSEKDINDEDLKALRKLSRELDSGSSPYFCIVSVLMLREGWDVRNVTTIVPLRPYSAKAGILPEQTLGRGLRRMTPPGQANEVVTVVEHEAFARLYQEELAQEGLPIGMTDVDKVPTTTVSIFPDTVKKDAATLDIPIPRLSAGNKTLTALGPIAEEEVRDVFQKYESLTLGGRGPEEMQYEGRHLITGEVVEHMKVNLALLDNGIGAISFYVQELEHTCKVKGTHQVLAPLLQVFLEEMLFGPERSIFDGELVKRLGDPDVREHVRAVFLPLVRRKIVTTETREQAMAPQPLASWRPFQVTASERRPVLRAEKTLFNLVPCHRALETAFAELLERCGDVVSFAKNAGPQSLRIDYLSDGHRLAFYTPDFFVKTKNGKCYLVETKGQVDRDVPLKARAAMDWSKAAGWEYVFVMEGVFHRYNGTEFSQLVKTCRPSLKDLIDQPGYEEALPLFAGQGLLDAKAPAEQSVVPQELLEGLPERLRRAADEAIDLFRFSEKKPGVNLAPVFTALLGVVDECAKGLVERKLSPLLPKNQVDQEDWFFPHMGRMANRERYESLAKNLRKTLVYRSGISPLGMLRSCLDYALNDTTQIGGIFEAMKSELRFAGGRDLLDRVKSMNDFRNTHVAHQETPLTDVAIAKKSLVSWIEGMGLIWNFGDISISFAKIS
ncbi:MAG: DEAD/DEAH box helicase family protein [Luteolibacter sp.]